MLNSFSWAKVKKLFPHWGFQRQTFPAGNQTLLGLDKVAKYTHFSNWKPLCTFAHSFRPLLGLTRLFILKTRKDPGSKYWHSQSTQRWSEVMEIGALISLISWLAHIWICIFWSLLKLTHDNEVFELGVSDFYLFAVCGYCFVLLFFFQYYISNKQFRNINCILGTSMGAGYLQRTGGTASPRLASLPPAQDKNKSVNKHIANCGKS